MFILVAFLWCFKKKYIIITNLEQCFILLGVCPWKSYFVFVMYKLWRDVVGCWRRALSPVALRIEHVQNWYFEVSAITSPLRKLTEIKFHLGHIIRSTKIAVVTLRHFKSALPLINIKVKNTVALQGRYSAHINYEWYLLPYFGGMSLKSHWRDKDKHCFGQ